MEKIKLDLVPSGKMPSLHASQFDDGRAYHIDLTENRVPYTLDGTETISVIIRKCDNTLVSMDIANTFADKSYIEFEVVEQMTACSGFNYGEIILEKNGDRLGSLNFYLQVEAAPDENGITSQSEIKNLERQVHDIVVEELEDNGAEETGYDNTESGLEATNVQDAIDEVNTKIENIPSVDAYTKEQSDEKYATKTELSDKADVSAIPTKTSQLQNDSGFTQIDDSEASASKTYSSNKVASLVGDVQNEINNVNNGYSWQHPTATWTTGYINNIGNIRTDIDTNQYSSAIFLGDIKKIAINYSRSNASITTIGFYSKDTINQNNLVSRIYNVVANTLYDVPNNARYVVFTLPNAVASNDTVFLFTEALGEVNKDISNLKGGYYLETINPTMSNGYVNNIGEVRTGSTYLVSEEVSVAGIEAFALNFTLSNINYMYIAFYGETPSDRYDLIQGYSSVTSGNFIQVPSNAKYVRFTIPTVYTSDYIITKKVSNDYNIKTALDRRTNNEETGVIFGDSIIYGLGVIPQGGQVPYQNAVAVANRILGGTIYNAGLGGSTMCRPNSPNGNNFCELVDALCGITDWATIDARVEDSIEHDSRTKGYRKTIGALKTLDFTTVDYVVIAYGTNDWTSDYNVGDDTSVSDQTYAGALKYCLEKLATLNPALKIYIVAPAYRYNQGTLVDSNTETHNGKNLREYAQGIEDFVKLYSLPCLNLYTNGNVNIYNRATFLTDGVHRTLDGYKLLGQQIAKLVMSK